MTGLTSHGIARLARIVSFAVVLGLFPRVVTAQPRHVPNEAGWVRTWVDSDRVERLEQSLKRSASYSKDIRAWSVFNGLFIATMQIGTGIYMAIEADDGLDHFFPGALVFLSVTTGTLVLVNAIINGLSTSPAERRLDRWTATRDAGKLDSIAFARFEGELAGIAQAEYSIAFGATYAGPIALTLTGGATLALTAIAADTTDERVFGYTLSGVTLAGALVSFVLADSDTFGQRVWREYVESTQSGPVVERAPKTLQRRPHSTQPRPRSR